MVTGVINNQVFHSFSFYLIFQTYTIFSEDMQYFGCVVCIQHVC